MQVIPHAEIETRSDKPDDESYERDHLSVQNMGECSTGAALEPPKAIEQRLTSSCKAHSPWPRGEDEEDPADIKNSETVKHCGDFRQTLAWLINEVRTWKGLAVEEYQKRTQVESEVNQLKKKVREVQIDKGKLERYLHEWKLVAEQERSRAVKYFKSVQEIRNLVKEL